MDEEPPGFDIDDQGMITLFPAVTFRTGVLSGMTVGLRIEYRSSPDRNAKVDAIQLALTPEQCLALVPLLQEAARVAMEPPSPETSAH